MEEVLDNDNSDSSEFLTSSLSTLLIIDLEIFVDTDTYGRQFLFWVAPN